MYLEKTHITESAVKEILQNGVKKIAPLWSLENFVAVNPYLGMSDQKFSEAMEFLHTSGKVKATLPIDFYKKALESGKMNTTDVAYAIQNNTLGITQDAFDFIRDLNIERHPDDFVKTIADVADDLMGKKWSRFMVDRISFWASAYFDDKQAIWDTAKNQESLFKAWKIEAEVDYSTEATGLKGFRKLIKKLPGDYVSAAIWALEILEIPEDSMEHYINSLLMRINGWAGFALSLL